MRRKEPLIYSKKMHHILIHIVSKLSLKIRSCQGRIVSGVRETTAPSLLAVYVSRVTQLTRHTLPSPLLIGN